MRKGKMIAQGAHASMGALLSQSSINSNDELIIKLDERSKSWLMGKFKKITVGVDSEQELISLRDQAKERGLLHCLIQDSGLTEFKGVPTYTALAIGPDNALNLDPLTGNLKLL